MIIQEIKKQRTEYLITANNSPSQKICHPKRESSVIPILFLDNNFFWEGKLIEVIWYKERKTRATALWVISRAVQVGEKRDKFQNVVEMAHKAVVLSFLSLFAKSIFWFWIAGLKKMSGSTEF